MFLSATLLRYTFREVLHFGGVQHFGRTALGGNIFWSATLSVVPAHGTKVVIVKPPEGLPTLVSGPIIKPFDPKRNDDSVTEVRF